MLWRARLHALAIWATLAGVDSTAASTRQRAVVCPAGRASASPAALRAPSRRNNRTTSWLSASPSGDRGVLTACCRSDRFPLMTTAYCQIVEGAANMDFKLELLAV